MAVQQVGSIVFLADGRQIRANVERVYNSGTIELDGQTITVEKLAEPYEALGYGEVVVIQRGKGTIPHGAILRPDEYTQGSAHIAIDNSGNPLICQRDQAGQWRELTAEEYAQMARTQPGHVPEFPLVSTQPYEDQSPAVAKVAKKLIEAFLTIKITVLKRIAAPRFEWSSAFFWFAVDTQDENHILVMKYNNSTNRWFIEPGTSKEWTFDEEIVEEGIPS